MPRRSQRTNSLKKIKKRLPGGLYVIHYKKEEPSSAICAECKKHLHGVASGSFTDVKNAPRSKKKPTRLYGGNLCAACTKNKISQEIFQKKR